MMYRKAIAEVLRFDDFVEFMTGSLQPDGFCSGYEDSVGHYCGTYIKGSSCSNWTTPSWDGSCNEYNGRMCSGYSDSTHPTCGSYGISCANF